MGEIIKFAREQRVTQIFIGHTQRPHGSSGRTARWTG